MNLLRKKLIVCIFAWVLFITPDCSYAAIFKSMNKELNIEFIHSDNRNGTYQFTETSGSGTAWVDYDEDGDLDLLYLNGSNQMMANGKTATHQLLENKDGHFIDVTKQSGLSTSNKTMGVCAADVNADRKVDLYITQYGQDYLYLNQSGIENTNLFKLKIIDPDAAKNQWSTSCAFGDVDNDGDVDLYVTRYVEYSMNGNKDCVSSLTQGYCNPIAYSGQQDALFLNDGDGNFTNVTLQRGLKQTKNDRGFGVVLTDLDNDEDLDIYVANDGSENRLYVNNGSGFFNDQGLISGTAINLNGEVEAGMGIALGDVNNDGLFDIFVTHFSMESNTLYINSKSGFFSDSTNRYGILKPSYLQVGWGASFIDINNDGFQDIVVANGNIDEKIKDIQPSLSYSQPNQILINQQGKKFITLSSKDAFLGTTLKSSRGLAVGDYNNDGLADLSINNVDDTAEVFKNIHDDKNNWVGISLIGSRKNHSAIGAKVVIKTKNQVLQKEVISGGSFLSQSDFRLIFGLKKSTEAVTADIIWPDSTRSTHTIQNLNRYHEFKHPTH